MTILQPHPQTLLSINKKGQKFQQSKYLRWNVYGLILTSIKLPAEDYRRSLVARTVDFEATINKKEEFEWPHL